MSFRTDLPFAMMPVWVMELGLGDKAFRLYAVLAGMADYSTGEAQVKRKTLGERIGASVDTVDRAKQELIDKGALTMAHHDRNDGSQGANVYVVHRVPPHMREAVEMIETLNEPEGIAKYQEKWGRMGAAPPPQESGGASRMGAAPSSETLFTDSSSSSKEKPSARLPKTVGGQKVTEAEHDTVDALLARFNEKAGTKFAGKEWRESIVRRIREHPEVVLGEHLSLIDPQFVRPWWKGDPTPSVIWGNGRVFDRALNGAQGPKPEESKYTRD